MDIAKEVFLRKRAVRSRLKDAGFVLRNNIDGPWFVYSEKFMDGDLTATIKIKPDGSVLNTVRDSESQEEYLPLNIEGYTGTYVGKVREEYKALLERVAERCFDDMEFASDQANRIAGEIERKFSAPPEHPFKGDGSAVFRNPSSDKWFALDMCVERSKIDDPFYNGDSRELIDIMNVKVDPDTVDELLKEPGICRCYHMNKKYWVTLTMDDRLSDEEVMELIKRSFLLTMNGTSARRSSALTRRPDDTRRYWIIPSNPANYDVDKAFRDSGNDTLAWHHRINVLPGDIVYIYQTEPVASIMWECEVLESFLPRPESWGRYARSSKYRMTLKRLRSFKKGDYPRSWLNEHGVKKTVRGQRSAPDELVRAIKTDDAASHDR